MKTITVLENGKKFEFSFEDMLKYHGVGYPGRCGPCFSGDAKGLPAFRRRKAFRTPKD